MTKLILPQKLTDPRGRGSVELAGGDHIQADPMQGAAQLVLLLAGLWLHYACCRAASANDADSGGGGMRRCCGCCACCGDVEAPPPTGEAPATGATRRPRSDAPRSAGRPASHRAKLVSVWQSGLL
jgi:hypothetical protein